VYRELISNANAITQLLNGGGIYCLEEVSGRISAEFVKPVTQFSKKLRFFGFPIFSTWLSVFRQKYYILFMFMVSGHELNYIEHARMPHAAAKERIQLN
jgi:hypothetical protein